MPDATRRSATSRRTGARTRARLLEASRQVFAERGFAHARVADIARRAGTSHGTFYTYFTDKHDAFAAVSAQLAASLPAVGFAAPAEAPATLTPQDAFARRLRALADALAGEHGVLRAWDQAGALDPALEQKRRRFFDSLAEALAEPLQRDPDRALLVPGLDLRIASSAILDTIEGLVVDRLEPDFALDEHGLQQLTGLWVRALYA